MPPTNRIWIVISLILAIAYSPYAAPGVYKCLNAQQRVIYQDQPCHGLITAKLPGYLSQTGGKAESRHFLWKATSGKGTAYLLGSMHFGSQDIYPLPVRIMDAYRASDALVVEANVGIASDREMASKLTAAGTYGDGSGLDEHVKPATWQETLRAAQKLGLSEETLRPQKPWTAAMTLSSLALQEAGYDPNLGIDRTFIREAGAQKPIFQLESVDQQLQLFETFSPQEQEQLLLQSLQDLAKGPDQFKQIIDAWKNGDAEAMDIAVRQGFDSGSTGSKLFRVLLTDRNVAMSNKIDELLRDGKTYFIVIGAAHLVGDQGILKQLERKGYTVTQP